MTDQNQGRADALTDEQRSAIGYAARMLEQFSDGRATAAIRTLSAMLAASPVEQPAAAPIPKLHCQNRGDVCLAGNRDGVCCPEDSCDIDDGVRKDPRMAQPAPSPADERAARVSLLLTHEQVSALYVHLAHRNRPEFGWIESPLVAIEEALKPAHNAIHDREFNAMNRQFFSDDRFKFDEAEMPSEIVPQARAASASQPAGERAAQELLPIDRKWVTAKAISLVAEYRNCKASETEEVMQRFVDYMQAALQDAAARAGGES
ncbi:hypothetical protein [Burkholderia vietnamiensis]|uniref:hypothetical protein n=1 Tax=Burkholderia vietnamiensis TaxID=60552 RepID=UPI001594BD3C|nr:hypothetical protein [Burkholderia vietnamiensis]MCA7943278.1 hypothetical protein [Burkholderia vietnamiensis]HDR8974007.1 hypothetical protein [Burkholderia vietnamiensis]HDR9142387.1 hypothetical protein [Burkholderia vietnamiensis]